MSRVLTDEVAIITGASSGIGAATAWEFARRGASVVLAARRVDQLEVQVSKITQAGFRAIAVPTDVTDAAQVEELVEQTRATFGRVDVLVNNAGIGWLKPLAQSSIEEITHITSVNMLSAISMTRAVLPDMLNRHHGAIIFVSSVSGHIAVDPLYSATKFGLRGFSLALRRELAGSGVSASVVSPGFVRTPMSKDMQLRMPGPEVVAKTIAVLANRPRREVVVPGYYQALIAIEHLFPWLADLVIRYGRLKVPARQ